MQINQSYVLGDICGESSLGIQTAYDHDISDWPLLLSKGISVAPKLFAK